MIRWAPALLFCSPTWAIEQKPATQAVPSDLVNGRLHKVLWGLNLGTVASGKWKLGLLLLKWAGDCQTVSPAMWASKWRVCSSRQSIWVLWIKASARVGNVWNYKDAELFLSRSSFERVDGIELVLESLQEGELSFGAGDEDCRDSVYSGRRDEARSILQILFCIVKLDPSNFPKNGIGKGKLREREQEKKVKEKRIISVFISFSSFSLFPICCS